MKTFYGRKFITQEEYPEWEEWAKWNYERPRISKEDWKIVGPRAGWGCEECRIYKCGGRSAPDCKGCQKPMTCDFAGVEVTYELRHWPGTQ